MIQETQVGQTAESDPFGFRVVKSATPAAGELAGERPQQDEVSRLHRQDRPAKPFRARSSRSDVEMRRFVLVFVAMLCATFMGFVSEIRPVDPTSSDHGYDETLETRASSPFGANLPIQSSREDVAISEEKGTVETNSARERLSDVSTRRQRPNLTP